MSLDADTGYRAAVTEAHRYARQLFVCSATGVIIEELPIDPGTALTVSGSLVRRSGNLVIPNRDFRYTPSTGGLIDFGKSYLLRFVVVNKTSQYACDQPLLFADLDEMRSGAYTVTLPVSDGMRIVGADAVLSVPLSFVDGTAVATVVRAVLVAFGAPDDDDYYDLDDGGAHLTGDFGYEVGASGASILQQLLTDNSLDLRAAPPLVYTLAPVPDAVTATPVTTWQLGSQVRIIDYTVTRRNLARNHAVVEGLDPYGSPFTQEVFDLNDDSPVRYGLAGVGDLAVHYKSDGISTPEQAAAVGRSLLQRNGVQRTFVVEVPIDASLDRRDVVRIVDPSTGLDVQGMLDEFPLPVAPGSHQITVTEARDLD